MYTRDQNNDPKALRTLTTPALSTGGGKDAVDDFMFAVSYKEKYSLVPTYMANATNRLLHDLAEFKEKCKPQLEKELHHSANDAGNHTVTTYGTTEDIATKLNNIITSLLEKSRETPIDVNINQPHVTVEEALKTSESEIMQDAFLSDVLKWMAAHPYATAFHIAMVLLMLCPGIAIVPLLEIVGFGSEGIIAGSVAAAYQSVAGEIAARSLFAVLQSTAMGGYGVFKVYTAVRAAIALAITFEAGRADMQHGCGEKLSLIPTADGEAEVTKARWCAGCVLQ